MENKHIEHDHQNSEMMADFLSAFEDFKDQNDLRLKEIEDQKNADPLTLKKLEKIEKYLDQQQEKMDQATNKHYRPDLNLGETIDVKPYALGEYVKAGNLAIDEMMSKGYSLAQNDDGSIFVPEQIETNILKNMEHLSPMRQICKVQQISTSQYKKPFAIDDFASGWVNDDEARPETDGAEIKELIFPTKELYAMPAATLGLIEDSAINLEAWIGSEIEYAFAKQENEAFINGDGIKEPYGLLSAAQVSQDQWSWGKLGVKLSGADNDFQTGDGMNCLLDLIYSLKVNYRNQANWVMNRHTQAAIRKLKDGDGNYLWVPAQKLGEKPHLLNYPITEVEQMPNMASDEPAIAFGDFMQGYLIVDRRGISILRDPYSAKPYILFYTTKRVGGGVHDFDAIKLLKFSDS